MQSPRPRLIRAGGISKEEAHNLQVLLPHYLRDPIVEPIAPDLISTHQELPDAPDFYGEDWDGGFQRAQGPVQVVAPRRLQHVPATPGDDNEFDAAQRESDIVEQGDFDSPPEQH